VPFLAPLAVLALTVAGCTAQAAVGGQPPPQRTTTQATATSATRQAVSAGKSAADLRVNVVPHATDVTVDTPVTVRVRNGTLDTVVFRAHQPDRRMAGTFNSSHTKWTASDLLEPGTRYVVSGHATDASGRPTSERIAFRTQDLTLDQQTFASITPLQHDTVGVGMPVIVHFDVPVTDRAEIQRHMHVTSSPATPGTWHWVSDTEVHWRPKHFWQPGTQVHVDLALNGVNAGNGIYGQMSRSVDFTIGKSVVMKPNLRTDQMKVLLNGRLARTIPITGGMPGFATRSGIKLIVEKFKSLRMDSTTVGIAAGSPNAYNIPNVQFAQRVTFSGEFLHAAPWSVYAQGSSNVSHGCVGMSTANAAWLFRLTHPGDPVEVSGTHRRLEPGNGWTDWNQSFVQYKKGSAL
jgi:lipoprotein-anchoring transpeptidase ErfK/SrfK